MNSLIKILLVAVAATCAFDLATPAAQDFGVYYCWLEGAQEVPPTGSPATGGGCFAIHPETGIFSYDIAVFGLLAPETAAHIHGPAAPGMIAPVIFPLPLGMNKSGSLGTLTPQQLAELNAESWYVNVHTTLYPGGEVRGQIRKLVYGGDPNPCTLPVDETTWGSIKALYR